MSLYELHYGSVGYLNFLAERPGAVQSETAFAGGAMSQ